MAKKYLEDALDAGLARLVKTETENPSQDLWVVHVGTFWYTLVHFRWTHIGDRPSKQAVQRNGSGVELHRQVGRKATGRSRQVGNLLLHAPKVVRHGTSCVQTEKEERHSVKECDIER